jgi:pyruvate-ferredoxin/flavodoxin oxidoreductase
MRTTDLKVPKGTGYKFTIAVSPLDCMGCYNCVAMCPKSDVKEGGALTMVPQEEEAAQAEVWDYGVNKVTQKDELAGDSNVKASQFHKPLLEFSGSCAGCAETSYARLVTQLFGDRMFISNATGCSSIWGNPAATCPYTTDANGHGPAWNNSLFEDNAEHGFGMEVGYEAERDRVVVMTQALLESDWASDDLKAAATAWLEAKGDAEGSKTTAAEYVRQLEAAGTPEAEKLLAEKSFLTKKSFWIFGGDGWAYDIGFGGLDHVLAQNRDVNVFVFDTEVYSNTGGQASKASNLGQVAQFAAAGKDTKKKSLAEIEMSYGYVYVAQVAMGANPMQTLKAIREAEAYDGPSLIIGYSPCEMHSIKKGGMMHCQEEMKRAVDCGYWNLFRFNPAAAEGKKFTLDSKEPKGGYQDFLMNEARYARLTREFPGRAEELFAQNEEAAMDRYAHLLKLKEMYASE